MFTQLSLVAKNTLARHSIFNVSYPPWEIPASRLTNSGVYTFRTALLAYYVVG
jgi:hypothetical protein